MGESLKYDEQWWCEKCEESHPEERYCSICGTEIIDLNCDEFELK